MRPRRLVGAALGGVAAVVTGVALAARVSPWPGVLLLRRVGRRMDAEALPPRAAALREMVPDDVDSELDIEYLPGRRSARLDVHRPRGSGPLPTIVWIHGGGFIGGTKDDLVEYLQILAGEGFTVVGVDYTHAPTRTYPAQVEEIGAALQFLTADAESFGIDPERFVLAGDSAGAHMAAQAAIAIVDGTYAASAGLPRPIPPRALRALLLCCGPYQIVEQKVPGVLGFFVRTVMWAYSGTRDAAVDPRFAYASLSDHVTAELPPTYVTCGNNDPLRRDSERFVQALLAAGVDVDVQLYGDDHPNRLDHEYQIDLRLPEALASKDRMVALVARAAGDGSRQPGVRP